MRASDGAPSPVAQALDWSFKALQGIVVLLAIGWLVSGVHHIGPGEQAVVLRAGAVQHAQSTPGLLLAWPQPFDEVLVVPGPDSRLSLHVADLRMAEPIPERGGFVMTADGGMIHAEAELTFRVADPVRYALVVADVDAALRRVCVRELIHVCGSQSIDSLLIQDRAAAVAALTTAMQTQVHELALGVHIERVDLTLALPPAVKAQFDQSQTALAQASQRVAKAQTDSTRKLRQARTKAASILREAEAHGQELVAESHERTAAISALLSEGDVHRRRNLATLHANAQLRQLFDQVGKVVVVPKQDGVRLRAPTR